MTDLKKIRSTGKEGGFWVSPSILNENPKLNPHHAAEVSKCATKLEGWIRKPTRKKLFVILEQTESNFRIAIDALDLALEKSPNLTAKQRIGLNTLFGEFLNDFERENHA